MVQLRHEDLIQKADHSEESYWQCLSPSSNVENVPLKESQCLSQVCWICNVESKIHPEGWYEGFIKAGALAHVYSIFFHHTEPSSYDYHFTVSIHQLYGRKECSRVPLHEKMK